MDNLIAVKDIGERVVSDLSVRRKDIPITEDIWERIRKESYVIVPLVSNRCNNNCGVCAARTLDGKFDFSELRVEDIKYILKRIGRNKKLCLSGGEPTLNEDLFEFIRLTKDSGNIPFLFTNGIRLADFNFVEKLVQSGLEKIYLSIDGLTPWVTQHFDGDKKFLDYKLKALENLKKLNTIKVCLSCRIARGINEDQIQDILDFAIVNNELIKEVAFSGVTPIGWFNVPRSSALYSYDLISPLEKFSKGNLSQEYFYEFTKLRQNLDSLLHKVGKHFPRRENAVYASIENGTLRELFSTDELKAINKHLRDKKYHMLIKYLFRYKNLFGIYRRIFKPAIIEIEFYKRSGLLIELKQVRYICEEDLETAAIIKQGRFFKVFGGVIY